MLGAACIPSVGLTLASDDMDAAVFAQINPAHINPARSRVYVAQATSTAAGRAAALAPKDPAEAIAVAVDFSAICSSVDFAAVACEAVDGAVDAAPADMLLGAPLIRGARVIQLVRGGLDGTAYRLRFTIDAGPLRLVETALIRVATQH